MIQQVTYSEIPKTKNKKKTHNDADWWNTDQGKKWTQTTKKLDESIQNLEMKIIQGSRAWKKKGKRKDHKQLN